MEDSMVLCHHGIKGQKWGTRNGPPYPLNDSDHSSSEKKAARGGSSGGDSSKKKKIRHPKIDIFKKKRKSSHRELTDEEKENLKTAAIGVGAGLATGAAIAGGLYLAQRHSAAGMRYMATVVKKGTTIQTLSTDPNRINRGRQFYTNIKKKDAKVYEGGFTKKLSADYKIKAKVKDDMYIAEKSVGKEQFNKLMREDPEFRKGVKSLTKELSKSDANKNYHFNGDYDKFNAMVLPVADSKKSYGQKAKPLTDKYYGKLEKLGYSGIEDARDRRYQQSIRSESSTIIFNKDKIGDIKVESLDKDSISKARKYANNRTNALKWKNDYQNNVQLGAAFTTGSIAGGVAANEVNKRKKNNGR